MYTVPELARLVDRYGENLRVMVKRGHLQAERLDGRIRIRGAAWHAWAQLDARKPVAMRERLRRMKLRMCDENTGEIAHTRVSDVWETGVRPVFRVTLENGYQIKMTKDHRCLTEQGWMTLERATRLRVRPDGGVTWSGDAPGFAVNGVPCHRSTEWLSAQRAAGADVSEMAARAGVSYHTIRKALRVHRLQFTARERARLSGLAQRGQKRTLRPRVYTEEWLRSIRKARSGPRSNFWKGGITPERANIGRWTREHAHRVHARNGFQCVLCGSKKSLHAHHVDPAWNNVKMAREEKNLTSLCRACHTDLHRLDLEIELLRDWEAGRPLSGFWARHRERVPRPARKRKPKVHRLLRGWSRISRIEFAGEEMTYDLEVTGPFHNFVANGLIVHNSVNEYSGRYSLVPDRFWVPDLGAIAEQDTVNRQGRADLLRELAD
ncbi:MAG TPA: HNH endonuclease, partial [Candidatus Eisenbacteria bacterium]|nr:HNH endonuclease [Candidatus Eisenbacteria bacterium]